MQDILILIFIMLNCHLASVKSFSRVTKLNLRRLRVFPSSTASASFLSQNRLYMSSVNWPTSKVRDTFINYFVDKQDHVNHKSSPVVPVNDPTLLFANAGMNQFKPIFIGTVDPSSPLATLNRAVNSQKCIRAGGKHNDLDDVGKDTYHHTFFEMLGTWSFGNYFKEEAIDWAWDLLTNVYKLPPERLYASYFGGDEEMGLPADTEARDFWSKYLPSERILPFDKSDNFWEMGDTGPCGPCSEIHFDRIGNRDASALVNADDPDVIEIWNLVFIQYNRENNGELRQLPAKHVDTGMGLERLSSILQEKSSNYDTDAFMPIFEAIQKEIGCQPYGGKLDEEDAAQGFKDTAYRVVADHLRTLSFAIADGAVPSNEGRGYVLRRVLRRCVRYGLQTLGANPGFLSKLVPTLVREMGDAFPELKEKQGLIVQVIDEEEKAFSSLLDRGIKYLNDVVNETKAKGEKQLSGDIAFYLYDTLGFPLDLTQIMADELGVGVDATGFQIAMEQQKERGRAATKAKRLAGRQDLTLAAEQIAFLQNSAVTVTDDSHKYIWDSPVDTTISAIYLDDGFVDAGKSLRIEEGQLKDGATIGVILKDTPFYAESGGQIADSGTITIGNTVLEVIDVQVYAGYVLHVCIPAENSVIGEGVTTGASVVAAVDYIKRRKIAPNHTMTHVLNYALRQVVGADVDQKGSLVTDEKFRFDFSCGRALKTKELNEVEAIVNDVIDSKLSVSDDVVPLHIAKSIYGLRAVFGEIYPDPVRVISVGPQVTDIVTTPDKEEWAKYSVEFCGGTHLQNTGDAEAFVITEETAVAKGIRRISGVTGTLARQAMARAAGLMSETGSIKQQVGGLVTLEKPASTETIKNLDKSVVDLKNSLDELLVAQSIRSELKKILDQCQKDLSGARNRALMAVVDQGIKAAKVEAEALQKAGTSIAVLQVDIGSDSKGVKRAIDEIKKIAPDLAFLGISKSEVDDKVLCFSWVPEEHVSAVKANEWVSNTLEVCGGRGGGKPNMAQGSAAGAGGAAAALVEAKKFIRNVQV